MCFRLQALLFTFLQVLALFSQEARSAGGHQGSTLRHGRKQVTSCNLFQGNWVFDPSWNPIYDSSSCPFIDGEFDCIKYGRPDKQFLKYVWKPDSCNLPRYTSTSLGVSALCLPLYTSNEYFVTNYRPGGLLLLFEGLMGVIF